MSITIVQVGQATLSGSGEYGTAAPFTLSINRGVSLSSLQNGDVLLRVVGVFDPLDNGFFSVGEPGWHGAGNGVTGTEEDLIFYYKIITDISTESSTYVCTFSDIATTEPWAVYLVIRGANNLAPIDQAALFNVISGGFSIQAPALTPLSGHTGDLSIVVYWGDDAGNPRTFTTTSGYTNEVSVVDSPNNQIYTIDAKLLPGSGTQTPAAITTNSNLSSGYTSAVAGHLLISSPGLGYEDSWSAKPAPVSAKNYIFLPSSDEVAAGLSGAHDEFYWINSVRPTLSTLYQSLPYVDKDELPSLFGPIDEDFWQNPVRSVAASLYQVLPALDKDEVPALFGQPDEDFWRNPTVPVPARLYQLLPIGDPESTPSSLVGNPDEDYWRNPTAPVAASVYQPLPLSYKEEVYGNLLKGPPDEDFWSHGRLPSYSITNQRLRFIDTDEASLGTGPSVDFGDLFFTDDDMYLGVPDELIKATGH